MYIEQGAHGHNPTPPFLAMSSIKKGLRSILKRRQNDDDDYMLEHPNPHHNLRLDYNSADEDASSVMSYSTTSTVDDNPGTGRLVDKYLYQKGGRKVQKLIPWVRIKLPNVHPVLISRTLGNKYFLLRSNQNYPLSFAIFMTDRAVFRGLQNLVRQTQ